MNEPRRERFLALSAELTAFKVYELAGTGMADDYIRAIDEIAGPATLDALLDIHAGLPAGRERKASISRSLLGDTRVGPIARNIMRLWYTGTWNRLPAAWAERYGPAPNDRTFVVSPGAYVEGLMWKAIGAHPAGAKGPGYGSWRHPPVIPAFEGDPAPRKPDETTV